MNILTSPPPHAGRPITSRAEGKRQMPARIVPWTPLTLQLHGRLRRERASPSVSRRDNRPLPGPARRPRALTGRRCGPWVRLAWNDLPAGASLVPITTPFEAFHRSTLRRWFSSPGCTSRLPASRASDSHVMPGSVPRGPAQTSIAGRVRRGLLRHTSPPSPVADDLPPPALRRAQDGVADLGRPVTVLKGGPGRQNQPRDYRAAKPLGTSGCPCPHHRAPTICHSSIA